MIPQWEAWTANKTVLASYRNSISGENGSATLKKRLVENKDSLKIKYDDLMRETGGSRDLSGVLQMIIAKANAADIKFVKCNRKLKQNQEHRRFTRWSWN